MFGKRLINTGGVVCPSDNTDLFGDGSGVALYRLNSSAEDSSGNFDGTATDVTYVSGHIDSAGSFNGSTSKIDLATNSLVVNQSAITLSSWVYFDNLNTQNHIITASLEFGFYDFGNGNIYFQPDCTSTVNRGYISNSGIYVINEWVHIVMVFDGSLSGNSNRLKVYINNVLRTLTYDGTIPATTNSGSGVVRFGGRGSGANFNGKLDQIRIFNKGISSTEVTTLYNEVAC
jgi:hypothetical protein